MTTREKLPTLLDLKLRLRQELDRQENDKEHSDAEDPPEQVLLARNRKFGGKCFKCGKTGHLARNCYSNNRNQNDKGFLVTAFGAKVLKHNWILDTGATNHLCHELDLISAPRGSSVKVQIADGTELQANRVGTVKLSTEFGPINLRDTLYVPGLRANLLSVIKATQAGYKAVFTSDKAVIYEPNGRAAISAIYRDGLYIVNERGASDQRVNCMSVSVSRDLMEWHKRLGHLNVKSVLQMSREQLVKGMENVQGEAIQCPVCVKNKLREDPYPKVSSKRANIILECVHSDICGPFNPPAPSGHKYFATFVDEKSRYLRVYPMKSREEIGEVFKEFKTFVENQTGKRIKRVRSDNAAEYKGGVFASELKRCGILHETTVPHCPAQNGIAERVNLTLINMVKCMLEDANLPKKFWVEALHTACYLRNRSATSALDKATPFEVFWGVKPNLQHLRPFGCAAIALNKGTRRSKLDPRGRECQLVGYSSHHKSYRLLDSVTGKVFVSRTVTFCAEGASNFYNIEEEEDTTEREQVQVRRNPPRAAKAERAIPEYKERTKRTAPKPEAVPEVEDAEFRDTEQEEIETPTSFEAATTSKKSKWW